MKLGVILEASDLYGLGHFKRQLRLKTLLQQESCEVSFYFTSKPPDLSDLPDSYEVLCPNVLKQLHASDLGSPDCLVIDHPCFPEKWVSGLDGFKRVVGFDQPPKLRSHLAVNISAVLGEFESQSVELDGCLELSGLKYFLFPEPSANICQSDKTLVSFGGTDPNRITLQFLRAARGAGIDLERFRVVLGVGFSEKYSNLLKREFKTLGFLDRPASLEPLIGTKQPVICSGGLTAFEVLHKGSHPVIVSQIPEQSFTARRLQELGLSRFLGSYEEVNWNELWGLLEKGDQMDYESVSLRFRELCEDNPAGLMEAVLSRVPEGETR